VREESRAYIVTEGTFPNNWHHQMLVKDLFPFIHPIIPLLLSDQGTYFLLFYDF
jgi:hypothetical protein